MVTVVKKSKKHSPKVDKKKMGSKILFVGSNPSTVSETSVPFENTRSLTTIKEWAEILGNNNKYYLVNVSDSHTEGNRSLTLVEIRGSLLSLKQKIFSVQPDKVVALGTTAQKALSMIEVDHFVLPHPSGLNRQLNNGKFVEHKLADCAEYIND